jgi:cytochrome P450
MGQVLIGRQFSVFNISSLHPRFKIYRKELQSGLSSRTIQTYLPLIADEIRVFLSSLSSSPENFISHIRRTSGAIILKIAYGWTVEDNDDYFVKLINDVFRLSSSVQGPGKYLVDVFPWLRFVPAWVPGAGFQRKAASIRQTMSQLERIPYQWAKEQIQSGEYVESYMSKALCSDDDKTLNPEEDDILNCCSQALYIGGADTTVSAMTTFFLMMTLHPQVQQRAQAEVERVVGKDRLANINDQKDLPYVVAVIKEVLRWAPAVPQGLLHRVTQDDTYQGFRIPKGTAIIANIWAITRDNEMYPNPEIFDPERFLPRPGVEAQADPSKWVFGFGRRVCPGALFAQTSIFLNVTAVLATFNISKTINAEGQEIEPTVGFIPEIITHAKPFDCRITPRAPDLLAALSVA